MADPAPLSKRPPRTDELEHELEVLRRQLDLAFDALEGRLADAETRASVAEARASVAEARASVTEARAADAERRAGEALHRVDELAALVTGAPLPARPSAADAPADDEDEDELDAAADEEPAATTGDEPAEDLRSALDRLRSRLEVTAPELGGAR